MFSVKEMIKLRKSVRSFDSVALKEEDLKKISDFVGSFQNPFCVPIEFRILNAKENGLSSPVITGADCYLSAKGENVKYFEIAFGYSFEAACLFAQSIGVGTVMLAGSLNRGAFEKAMELKENEIFPLASPIGYPAKKRSMRESVMRRALKADERVAFEKLFFDGSFENPLTPEKAGEFATALEMMRWAPSAVNKQPWRAIVEGETVHFFECSTMKANSLGDIQKVDIGIGLSHFDLTMKEEGREGRFFESEKSFDLPENMTYIISYERIK